MTDNLQPEMVMVPRVPTEAMLVAAYKASVDHLMDTAGNMECRTNEERSAKAIRPLWSAMLAAAPRDTSVTVEDGWQPISTAPRDGTRFLAYEDGNLYALEWHPEGPGDTGYWKCYCGQYVTLTPEPTHWRPLPTPPVRHD